MTLSGSADARFLLSNEDSDELSVKLTWSGFLAGCTLTEVRRRRTMKMEKTRKKVITDVENSGYAMVAVCKIVDEKADGEKKTLTSDKLSVRLAAQEPRCLTMIYNRFLQEQAGANPKFGEPRV